MRYYLKIILVIAFNLFILTACNDKNIENNDIQEKQNKNLEIGKIGNDIPIDRATVSKMLSLANYSKNEIINLERVINFKDTSEKEWYDKYINAVYTKGDMKGVVEDKFEPTGNLTLTQTQYLIDKYDTTKNVKIKIDNNNKDKPISYALWCDIYSKMMKDKNIEEKSLTILATSSTTSELEEYYSITDKGIYFFDGIDIDKYLNTKIKVLTKGLDVIAITEVLEMEPTLTRCYIEDIKNNEVYIFVGGARKILKFEDIEIGKEYIGKIADFKINGNNIISVDYYITEVTGEINKITNNTINISGINYVLDNDFKVYSKLGKEIKYSGVENLYIGEDIATFYLKGNENKIYSAIINKEPNFNKIKVLINNNDFKQDTFDEIQIYSEGGFKVYVKEQIKEYKQTDLLTIKKGLDFGISENETIKLELIDEAKGFKIKNLKRGYSEPVYFGSIEINKTSDKYILINNIDFEKYMEGVLASNSGNYENIETLKVMAVINRSIAMANIKENKFKEKGANIDDSSKTIIYNNLETTENIKKAILDTKGEIIVYNDEVIKPNYFGYSAGVTANSGEIWAGKKFKEFPAESKGYLKYKKLFEGAYDDLKEEVNANIFFKSKDINSIEKDSPWFRWTCNLEQSHIQEINKNIESLYNKHKNFIKTYENGQFIYKPIKSLGKIKDISITKRGEAGNVMEMKIEGEEETILLITDSVIKDFFNFSYILDNTGKKVENMKKLPSSYFVFDKVYDNNGYLQKLVFYGGGNGHGVGLSLYGANKLVEQGKKYDEIISYFYTDVKILNKKQ